jgi:hypothetical protein
MARLRFRIERDGGVGQGYEADYVGAASVFTRGMTLVRSPLGQRLSAGAVSGLSDLRPQELFSRVRLSPGRVRSGILVYTGEFAASVREDPRIPLEACPPHGSVVRPRGQGRSAACARIWSWNDETPSSGTRKAKHGWKPPAGSPKRRGRGSAATPRGKPSPASPSSCACSRPKKPTSSRTGACCCCVPATLWKRDLGPCNQMRG